MGEREICIQENMGAGDDGSTSVAWVVEMELPKNGSLKEKERGAWEKHSIYKLPKGFVRDEKRLQAYKPQVVSLGPYHHGKDEVKAMEEHKQRALLHLLVRTKKNLEEYWKALKGEGGGVLQFLMDSYKDLDKKWRKDEEGFLKMMILDGCFMMEVMRLAANMTQQRQQHMTQQQQQLLPSPEEGEYDANDPIFSYHGMLSNLPRIKRDMLMIENQIPLFVLHKLHAVEKGVITKQNKQRVNNTVLWFFGQGTIAMPPTTEQDNSSVSTAAAGGNDDKDVRECMSMGLHVLDVVRKSMIKDKESKASHRGKSGGSNSSEFDVIWPATQLQEAGVKFQKSKGPSLKDITFQPGVLCLRATLSLPQMVVDDATESKFLNLMAFEHLHVGSGKEVSSYVCFMDNIIDSDKDVSLLSRNKIIKNFVGTDQAVADLFNGISHDVSIDPNSDLSTVHRDVTQHCDNTFNKHCANLQHNYFKTPWSVIAFAAATVALAITIIQFVYTFLSYYNRRD